MGLVLGLSDIRSSFERLWLKFVPAIIQYGEKSRKKSMQNISVVLVETAIIVYMLGCAVLLCLVVCLTLLASFFLPSPSLIKHVYTWFCVWCHWWFHYPGLLLHTELIVSLFIRCTMRCEIWAQPAELPE